MGIFLYEYKIFVCLLFVIVGNVVVLNFFEGFLSSLVGVR